MIAHGSAMFGNKLMLIVTLYTVKVDLDIRFFLFFPKHELICSSDLENVSAKAVFTRMTMSHVSFLYSKIQCHVIFANLTNIFSTSIPGTTISFFFLQFYFYLSLYF